MKNTKKIGVLISLLLISIIALGAVSAADDVAVDDADVAAVEEVVEVNDAPATNEIDTGSEEIISDSDSADLQAVADEGAANPKDTLKAEVEPDEPLGAPDGTFTDLTNLISRATTGSTIVLDRNYVYANGDSTAGVEIGKAITIDGAGFTIDGRNLARCFRIATGSTVTLKNLNIVNGNAPNSGTLVSGRYYGGAIYSSGGTNLIISNCSFVNNTARFSDNYGLGGAIYQGSGRLTINHTEFYHNTANKGGAIYHPSGLVVKVRGSAFINNSAAQLPNYSDGATGGDNVYYAGNGYDNADYNENWWGTNYGPEYTIYSSQGGAYLTKYDYFIATEILTSPITIEVDMPLDSGNTPEVPLEPRHAVVTYDSDTCNTTEGYVPEAFTIEFTTSNDAYINVSIDNQYLILKVFAGENKKNITLDVTTADVTLPAQPVVTLTSDVDGIFNLTLGDQVFEVNVVDGVGVFDFAQEGVFVDVGKYTIIASRVDDPVYKTIFRTAEFEVKKYLNELTIEADKEAYTFGDDVTITPTFTPEGPTGTVTYFVDGATSGIELDVDDDLVLSGLAAGEHNVVAKYGGDGKYGPSESAPLTFTIAQAALEISVADVTVNYPDKGTVEVKANVDGKYTITVNDKDYEVIVVDGVGTFDVTEELEVGTYDIEWDIEESENYTAATGSAVYKVDKTTPTFLLAGDEEYSYGDEIDITTILNSDATGYLSFTLNGEDAGTINVNGVLTLKDLDAGHYTLIGNFPGDTNYGPATATLEFEVLPIDVIVTVETTDVAYPNTGSVSLTASAPGTYTIKIGDKTYTAVITEEDETVTVPVTDVFAVGKYPVAVTAEAHDNYKAVNVEDAAIYTVTKAQAVMTITYDAETDYFKVTLDGVDEKLSERYHILIDTEDYGESFTEDGVDEFNILYPGAGKHSAFVIFDGNDNYLGTYAQTSFDLPKLDTAVVTVSAEPTKETFPGVIEITLVDSESGEKLNGTVVVTIDDTDYAVDVEDGEGTLTINNLPAKTYPITAKFVGNDEYEEATGEGELLVNEWNEVIIVISPAEGGASATLIDVDMNNINGVAQVTVDGNDLGDLPVVDGKVDIPIAEEGDHIVTVYFAGDDEHPEAGPVEETIYVGTKLIPVTMTIVVADITYTEDAEAVVTLVSTDPKSGNVERLSGVVKVQIGEQVQEVTVTDGEGSTVFSGLNAGGKNAIATFESDGVHDTAVVTTTFNVAKMGTKIVCRNMTTTAINVTEDGRIGQYFYWNLYDAQGRPLVGKPVSIGFNANVYNRTTDANGQARLQINLQNAGTYTFAISFLGDENYEGAFEVAKITVNRQKANLTASGATYKASAATKTLTATYKTKAGKAIVGKTVKFTVNGKTYSAKTDDKGVAKVNVSLTKAGSYSVEVKATETNTYAEIIKTVTLKLT